MIKINFVDGAEWIKEKTMEELGKRFEDIEISDDPDFLIYSIGSETKYLKYDCVRIFYTEENIRPDFNLCDYAAEFADIKYGDRYLRMPNYCFYTEDYKRALTKHIFENPEELTQREFCNFVYSNGNEADGKRNEIFEKLSEYKIVSSGGRYRNNVGGPVKDKYEFQKKYKFTIAFENDSSPGYTTEKILQAFAARTIPIYWGDPDVVKHFNSKAFINCHDYASFDEILDKIKEIDNNDNLYLEYIKAPTFAYEVDENPLREWGDFLEYIINQGPQNASRRSKKCCAKRYNRKTKCCSQFWYIADKNNLLQRGANWMFNKRMR